MKKTFKPSGINVAQKQRSILDFVVTEMGEEVKITTGGQIGAAFADLYEYSLDPNFDPLASVDNKYTPGYLLLEDRKIDLEIDPRMKWDDTRIFVGEKEIAIEIEPMELI